ncbi:ribonuclease Z [Loigolactobacillus bifermentans]|uniref:Ribonuclease Z n=1 Tax=Loigolactobacillus bifermentans DSM 20003 TaxID=1423726 RepID=A0A0R1GQZ3_9LACO|nr:ribonuclease Z [Loigolactobacillus bifermentans]KRK34148.1 beta-lactamase superfamily hydrolase [Loigolactobacillus bifermentans DSM 20003]QGG59268.1 ribonuclease Z [Loigolactobacillus bifermentans]
MELEFLGTGAGSPAKFRNVTSVALKLLDENNAIWLFDVGEGTQQQILRTSIRPRKVDKIFITHLHGDHIFGLPGFLSSRSFQGGEAPLTIYGPKGIRDYVRTSLKISDSKLTYALHFVEITEPGVLFSDQNFTVSCQTLDHRITSFGYRIVEKDHVGELQVEQLQALGVRPGPIYGQLKAGKVLTLPDGQTLKGTDFIGPAQKGRIVAILGDTRTTPNSQLLAQDADVLVHESTFAGNEGKMAHNYYHSTSVQAANLAKRAHVQQLLLTHISARYVGKMALNLQNEARAIFPKTRVMKDFDQVKVPLRK